LGALIMNDPPSGLAKDLVSLAQEGVQFHARMSANPEPKEGFVRDWIAAKLHKNGGRAVAIEVNRGEFRCDVVEPVKREKFDDARPNGFQIDLVIWSPKPDDQPYALVELKRSADDKFLEDIRRTAKLLPFCKAGVLGYQMLCAAQKDETKLEQFVRNAKKLALREGCGPAVPGQAIKILDEGKDWGQIVLWPVLPSPQGAGS